MEAGGSILTICLDPRRLLPWSSPWPSYHSHQSGCLQGHSLFVPDLRASASLHPQSPGGFLALFITSPRLHPVIYYILAGAYSGPLRVIDLPSASETWYQVANPSSLVKRMVRNPLFLKFANRKATIFQEN